MNPSKEDIPIGEVFHRKNGKKYLAVEMHEPSSIDFCALCAFGSKPANWCSEVLCTNYERSDKKEVIFLRCRQLEEHF